MTTPITTSPYVVMQQKRGLKDDLPATAPDGQLLIATDTKELFFGTGTGREQIGGSIPSISVGQTKYVATSGSDATGDGSLSKPFATITAAQNAITDATPSKRYVIKIGPGNYSEGAFALKPNVFLVGDHYQATRITTTSCGLHSTWNATSGTDNRSGAAQLSFLSAVNFDFSTVSSAAGKLYFEDVTFGSTFAIKSFNSINQMMMDGCTLFNTMTFTGTTSIVTNTYIMGAVTINAATTANIWQHQFFSCRVQNNVTINGTGNTASKQTHVWFISSNISNTLTATGDYTYVNLTSDSTPENFDKITHITNGAQVFIKNRLPFQSSNNGFITQAGGTDRHNVGEALDELAIQNWYRWYAENYNAQYYLRPYAYTMAQQKGYNSIYYDNFPYGEAAPFVTAVGSSYWYYSYTGAGTVTTDAITIDAASTSFMLFATSSNAGVSYEYSFNGTTWTSVATEQEVTFTAGPTTLYIKATLTSGAYLWGLALLYNG